MHFVRLCSLTFARSSAKTEVLEIWNDGKAWIICQLPDLLDVYFWRISFVFLGPISVFVGKGNCATIIIIIIISIESFVCFKHFDFFREWMRLQMQSGRRGWQEMRLFQSWRQMRRMSAIVKWFAGNIIYLVNNYGLKMVLNAFYQCCQRVL